MLVLSCLVSEWAHFNVCCCEQTDRVCEMFGLSSRNKKVAVGIVLLAIAVRAGLWFMRSVPLCSWQANFLRVSHQPRAEGYDAVVIVGYAINYDRLEPTPQLRERLDAGAELLCDLTNGGPKTMADRAASHVVLSGGLARQQSKSQTCPAGSVCVSVLTELPFSCSLASHQT